MTSHNFFAEPGKQEITLSSTFNAPIELVFKTYIDPKRLPEWWGPRYLTSTVEKMEVKPGGLWRVIQCDAGGSEFAFNGVYHLVKPPSLIVSTFEYEGMPGHVILDTITFEEHGGKTTLTEKSVFQSVEDRDGMLQSGMEEGSNESMDRFAELLAKIQK